MKYSESAVEIYYKGKNSSLADQSSRKYTTVEVIYLQIIE